MSGSNGKNRWSSSDPIQPGLVDPTGQMSAPSVLPGFDGVPFKGPIPDLRRDDAKQPQVSFKAHVEILDLSREEQLQHYREICQLVANGFAQFSFEERQYDARKKNWRVFVRWLEVFTAMPKGGQHGLGGQ